MPAAAGFDGRGATVLRQKWPHGQVKIRLAKHTRHPNWRAVFERIVRSDEITVVELTPDSSIVGHLPASQITEAGWPDRGAGPRAQRLLSRRAQGLTPLVDWISVYGMARPLHKFATTLFLDR
jgi:hypothetical protein